MRAEAVVAGHTCLDIIPEWTHRSGLELLPGTITHVGPAGIATGGCMPNTGLALGRLGVRTRLVGKVGQDEFGQLVRELLERRGRHMEVRLLPSPGEHTSYSVILNPPQIDRVVLHYPGTNDTFTSRDLPSDALAGARLLHFGYPPIMRAMYEDGGRELEELLRRAKELGLTTSLDMAYPDPDSPAGRADWPSILERALPWTDVCVPSIGEILLMLGQPQGVVTPERVRGVGARLLEMGAAIAGVKLGERGLYLRTAGEERLGRAGPALTARGEWACRELWANVFEVQVVGTTGAGDATMAGLLMALLRGLPPEEALTAACAVGACSVEAPDATSGIPSWQEIEARVRAGWPRQRRSPGPGWAETRTPGVWRGPDDVTNR
ncbi:PfkB domain protein [Thermobaculum terrenum ATCC BAA-798]|uniref:PfkB domain protein n=1 Tax=Thermobaculum terrenum (strain ATCC BAA-798 / CCMEE 7001 / YNP1) TaxID=525904 RepID=D1CI51_THET1|nr:carbohydrate kinase family protein [Thermobaculum terrenum]ACZ43422.1 PfkB domain protein [Thermobaculum terrenum ATCC BAA-798]